MVEYMSFILRKGGGSDGRLTGPRRIHDRAAGTARISWCHLDSDRIGGTPCAVKAARTVWSGGKDGRVVECLVWSGISRTLNMFEL